MKHRSIAAVVILTLITFGLYGIYWAVVTAREMRKLGANIPNAILIIIPIASYYWFWRYSAGVELVTKGKWATPLVFLLFIITGIGGIVLGQLAFNEDVAAGPATAGPGGTIPAAPNTASPAAGTAAAGGVVGLNQPGGQDTSASGAPTQVAEAPSMDTPSNDGPAPMQDISPAGAPSTPSETITPQEPSIASDDQPKEDPLSQSSTEPGENTTESSDSGNAGVESDTPSPAAGESTGPESDTSLSSDNDQNPTV